MKCFHCGENLNKSDIFCMKCKTPVLTEDDAALVNYSKTLPNLEQNTEQFSDTMHYIGEAPSELEQSQDLQIKLIQQGSEQAEEDQLELAPPKKGKSRTFVIIATLAVCIALVGIGLFFLISPQTQQDGPEPSISDNGSDIDADNGMDNGTEPNADLNQAEPGTDSTISSQEITAINILSGGRVQTEFHAMVHESFTLSARIVPEGIDVNIVWTSSDPDVLEVAQVNERGREAHITGLAAGVADIIVSAGNFEYNYVVFVDNLPMHLQLESAIESIDSIWLTILWSSGPHSDNETLFERDGDSQAWTMGGASGTGEVTPIFGRDDNALTITIPTSTRVYYLFADSTGNFKYPDGTDSDDFFWWFMTTQIEPEG